MYEVITHGGGEVLWNTFNAVAIFFNKTGVMGGLLHIAFNLAIIVAITQMVITQDSIKAFKWSFLALFVINALLLPKVDVLIIDRAAVQSKKVDNVPFVLGFSASFASKMGDFLATKFDEVFSPPGLEYTKTGVGMASKLVSSSPIITLSDPDSAENYTQFVRSCLMVDLVRGKYTAKEFYNVEDTWDFLAKTSSPIRGFPYKKPDGKSEILTCRKVAEQEKSRWSKYLISSGNNFSKLFFPNSPKPLENLLTHFPVSYEYLTEVSQDSSTILRQVLMRNIIMESVAVIDASNGNVETARSLAATKAQIQQKNTYMLHGDTASMSLSTLKILFEVLVYALFPIAATIALFPGGLKIAKEYLIMMLSIQMWAPMYAVLNMVLNVTAKSKSMAAVTVIGASGEASRVISYSTIPKLVEANEWVSAVAGYGMSLIPFLAYGLFRYGAGALTQISSHFGGVAQSALSGAADMQTTGSVGIGNRSFDTHSQSNVNAFKHNTNVDVAAGKTSVQELDGSGFSVTADGTNIYNREAAMSQLGMNIDIGKEIRSTFTERISNSMAKDLNVSKDFASTVTTGVGAGFNKFGIKASLEAQGRWNDGLSEKLDEAISYAKERNVQNTQSASIHQKGNQEFTEHLERLYGGAEGAKQILSDPNKTMYEAEAFINKKVNAMIGNEKNAINQQEKALSKEHGEAKFKVEDKWAYQGGEVVGEAKASFLENIKNPKKLIKSIYPVSDKDDFDKYTKPKPKDEFKE